MGWPVAKSSLRCHCCKSITLAIPIAERRADGANLRYRLFASQSFDTLNWRILWLHRPPMRLSLKIACVVTILALLGIVAVAVHRHRLKQDTAVSQLYNETAPIAKGAPRIPASALGPLTSADFMVVTNLRYLPSRVKESFCNVEDCDYVGIKFDMVNPGETMSTDYILPGVPNKRLVFAALNKDSAIVVYEKGGYANLLRTTILDFRDGRAWDTTLNSFR
jgi:hypothetical protein